MPFPVGGIADIYSRLIGNRWTELWGQAVVVENRTGAGGNIAAELVAKSAPDGYTLVMGTASAHTVNVTLFSKLPYDPVRDFAPVPHSREPEGLLAVHPSVPANNVPDLIALGCQARQPELCLRRRGHGQPPRGRALQDDGESGHGARALQGRRARDHRSPRGPDLAHLRHHADGPAAHPGGQAARALATTGDARAAATPELPTVAETLPGFVVNNWVGLFAPAGTPPDIVGRLNAETRNSCSRKKSTRASPPKARASSR